MEVCRATFVPRAGPSIVPVGSHNHSAAPLSTPQLTAIAVRTRTDEASPSACKVGPGAIHASSNTDLTTHYVVTSTSHVSDPHHSVTQHPHTTHTTSPVSRVSGATPLPWTPCQWCLHPETSTTAEGKFECIVLCDDRPQVFPCYNRRTRILHQ